MKKQTKLITSIISLCLALVVVVGGAFALFSVTQQATGSATAGSVSIELKEDFPSKGGEYGENTTSKTFWGVATGSKKSIARASIFVSIEYKNLKTNNWEVLGSIPSNAVTYNIADSTKASWTEGNDGYWYYNTILEGNTSGTASDTYSVEDYTTTQFLITDVAIDSAYADIAAQYDTRINMLVTIESCQATNGAYQLSWGQVPEAYLPDGVYVADDLTD